MQAFTTAYANKGAGLQEACLLFFEWEDCMALEFLKLYILYLLIHIIAF